LTGQRLLPCAQAGERAHRRFYKPATATMVDLMVMAKTAVTAIAKPATVGMSAARGLRPRAHRGGGIRPDVAGKPLLGAVTRISVSRPPWRHRLL
jgi:hypothetical protein